MQIIRGRKKGYLVSEETKKKISEFRKGKLHSEKTKYKISIANKGKKRTEEMKKRIREGILRNPGKGTLGKKFVFSEERKMNMSLASIKRWSKMKRKKYKRYIHLTGTKNYKRWRSSIFERDNWTCQTCFLRSSSGRPVYLEVHHIKSWANFPESRFNVNNGITLCKECHKLTDNYKNKKNGDH